MIDRRDFIRSGSSALLLASGKSSFGAESAFAATQSESAKAAKSVTYDDRSVLLDGRRKLLCCGEIHYPRSTRAMWPVLLDRSKALGINTITSYVFWNYHETSRGTYDFSGDRDLGYFLDLCAEKNLSVFLRVGPYICAEWNFGGYPPYLRDEPGITFRTMNAPYQARVENWFERLTEVVKPRLANNGGAIVLMQVENEYGNVSKRYGEAGQEYLKWIVEMAKRVGLAGGVPTTTCEGGAQGAIETCNGFYIPQTRIDAVRAGHPGTPLLWTELYPAWYRVWGGSIAPARDARSMAGGILDFTSRGGSGFNYYPWHGGSNFGRTSMYLQTPTYDFFAPLDEYGAVTATGQYLGRLHAVLTEQSAILLEGDRSEVVKDTTRTTTWKHGKDELMLVQDDYQGGPADFVRERQGNVHVRLLNGAGQPLFDTDAMQQTMARSFAVAEWKPIPQKLAQVESWQVWAEPFPDQRKDAGTVSVEPVEQLSLTKDATDYCWYSTTVEVAQSGPQQLLIPYGGDFIYLYIDGQLRATSTMPLDENRGPITPEDAAHPRVVASTSEVGHEYGFRHTFPIPSLSSGKHRIDLLATAVGMIKGDWQIASPMNFERKGIWEGVQWNDRPLQNWTMRPGLIGEQRELATGAGWEASTGSLASRPLLWYRTRMDVPAGLLNGTAVFRLDAAGLGKGSIWVNGHGLGRHWLLNASRPEGTQSQRHYHVPADWLRASNEIVVFEEQLATPAGIGLQVRN